MSRCAMAFVIAIVAVTALLAGRSDWSPGSIPESAIEAKWRFCPPAGPRITCVVDGDTSWFAGELVRIADIDTPERGEPGDEVAPGTFRAAITRYRGSRDFAALAKATRRDYNRYLDIVLARWGALSVQSARPKHIIALRGTFGDRPTTANHLLAVLAAF